MDGEQSRMDGEREWLKQADHMARDFDKAVMTLSAGALGLSIAFVHDLAPHPKFVAVLAVAWSLFATSLLAILVSYLSSQESLRQEMDAIDQGTVLSTPGGSLGRVTFWLNAAATGTLISGAACFVVFAIINV